MEQQDNIKDKLHDEFLKGFEEGYAKAVDEAIKWLNENAEKYVWFFEGDAGLDDNFENDFREAMRKL